MKQWLTILMLIFAQRAYGQAPHYEKKFLFEAEWGDELHQLGRRDPFPGEIGRIGPHNFTVASDKIWIYDRANNYIKCFNEEGVLERSIQLFCQAGMEGLITSDGNAIYFHDSMGHRIWVYKDNGELEKTIKYHSPTHNKAFIHVVNGILVSGNELIETRKTGELYFDKPVYEGVFSKIDETSEYYPDKGRKTKRIYSISDFEVSPEGDIITPKLIIKDEKIHEIGFEEELLKKYGIYFRTEDDEGNFYVRLFPRDRMNNDLIFKYDSDMEKIAVIELPVPPQAYGHMCSPLVVDRSGSIYYMNIDAESVKFLKWEVKK